MGAHTSGEFISNMDTNLLLVFWSSAEPDLNRLMPAKDASTHMNNTLQKQ